MLKTVGKGRLTKDVELKYSQGEKTTAVAKFSIAVNRRFSKDNTADFIPCTAFGKTAEFIDKYFSKGDEIMVSGHLQSGSYTDKNKVKRYTLDLIVEEVDFCGSKKDKSEKTDTEDFMNLPTGIEEELHFN